MPFPAHFDLAAGKRCRRDKRAEIIKISPIMKAAASQRRFQYGKL